MSIWGHEHLATLLRVLAIFGILDAAILATSSHSTAPGGPGAFFCFVPADCGTVTQSRYSHIWGIPLSWLGIAFYAAVLVLTFVPAPVARRRLLVGVAAGGALVSGALFFIQARVLMAFCGPCVLSGCLNVLILVVVIALSRPRSGSFAETA